MIKVGIAGIGFMGWMHWLGYQRVAGIEVAAIASSSPKKRTGDWTGIQGNFGPPGEQVDLSGVRVYENHEALLEDPSIDVIDVCLPPSQHAALVIAAAKKGKHVFCEKPMALNVRDAQEMVAACRDAMVQLSVGHVLPFFPEYAWAIEQIQSGRYGRLLGGTFKRMISNPQWIPDFYDLEKVGGPLIDLHVHDAHLIRLLFGMPTEVFSVGRTRDNGTVEYAQSSFLFENRGLVVSSTMGVIHQPGRSFTHGFEIHLERATLQFEFALFADGGEVMPVKLIDGEGNIVRPEIPTGDAVDAFAAEIGELKRTLEEGISSELLGGDLACDAIKICFAQANSVKTGKMYAV